ncbi:L,D-transpeptidase family protein [Sulfurimonas gotlandica]|uniref:L,D-transpeptidase family protein n=1 Tax=Sulfurimonas gotlandica TaxID=1176482 RepID=UPI001F5268F9|nr:L,D-transpeptidase family protein [Sulfurimonas gotlandica]
MQNFLYSSQQIILVVSDNFNSSKAKLSCYEDGKKVLNTIDVNIGTNGLAWGIGEFKLKQKNNDPIKKEGDKKAPAGIFKLVSTFGYYEKQTFNLNYIFLSKKLICVDDSDSKDYNKIIQMPKLRPKSFEQMRRKDDQYELGVVVAHNKDQKKQAGSCIFLHVQKSKDASTAGCTSMSLAQMREINLWLDGSKNPILIQVPKSSLKEIKELFPTLPL